MPFMDRLVRVSERWAPDAFVLAVLLTFLTFALVVLCTPSSPMTAVAHWGDGFWNLLSFTNQIILTLLFGFVLANTPPVRRFLLWIAGFAKSPQQAYMLICFVSGLLALVSWSWSMIAAALMSLAIGEASRKHDLGVHYPLLVASGFVGFVVWHQGLSGSIGLAIATPGHFLEEQMGIVPTAETLLRWTNAMTAAAVLLTLPWIMARLHPEDASSVRAMPVSLSVEPEPLQTAEVQLTPAQRLEHSRALCWTVVFMGVVFLWIHYAQRDGDLTLNTMNFLFLLAGLAGAGTLAAYLRLLQEGGRIAVPFLLQYPFYAGLAGLINGSGLGELISQACVSIASADSLPVLSFFGAGLLNIFIPSGGAQWAVQGPVMISSAVELGADIPGVAMAITLGDQWSNLIHPLTMIPILAVTGLSVRDMMGYCVVAFLWTGAIFSVATMLFF